MPSLKRFSYEPSAVPGSISPPLLDWLRREFQAVARGMNQLREEKVAVCYGSMGSYVDQPIADINATWQVVTQFGSDLLVGGGVVLDPVAGTFSVPKAGAYLLTFDINITHNESGSDRAVGVRLYNVTDAVVVSAGAAAFTPKNTGGTAIVYSSIFAEDTPGKRYAIQIGGGADTYTTCVITGKRLSVSGVGA